MAGDKAAERDGPFVEEKIIGPARVFAIVVATILIAETLIMLLLRYVLDEEPMIELALDVLALTVIVFPVLYFSVIRFLKEQNKTLRAAQRNYILMQDDLERQVAERTADIGDINEQMRDNLERLEASNRQVLAVGQLTQTLQACRTAEEAFNAVAERLSGLFSSVAGAVYLFSSSRNALARVVAWQGDGLFPDDFAPDQCWALRRGAPNITRHWGVHVGCDHSSLPEPCIMICLPINADGQSLGILALVEYLQESGPSALFANGNTDDVPPILLSVCENLGMVLSNIQFRERLRDMAVRDQLTGLYNRRFLDESLEIEVQRAKRHGHSLSVIMFDIDHFKRFNDRYGHEAGDRVLATLGRHMHSQIRRSDIACRFGGEEFLVVLPHSAAEDAVKRADVLRRTISALETSHEGKPLEAVTISCGVASLNDHAEDAKGLIHAADAALYASKRNGRDQVTCADSSERSTVVSPATSTLSRETP